jgi:ubiquinone/menaquinone biosynthesis C-methylase UbiE
MAEKYPHSHFEGNQREQQVLTARGYETVRQELSLDEKKIGFKNTILSVGEGLSDFAYTLERKTGAAITSLDALYDIIDRHDTLESAGKKLTEAGIGPIRTGYKNDTAKPLYFVEQQEQKSGSIYAIPAEDHSFDLITANHLLEHIDLQRCLPELLRVLKKGGEIRFGGTPFSIYNPHEDLPSRIDFCEVHFDGYNPTTYVYLGLIL